MSRHAESLWSSPMIGKSASGSSPKRCEWTPPSRTRIQFTFPRSALISPLWQMKRYGCERGQVGKVFVEKRECTSAIALSTVGSARSP